MREYVTKFIIGVSTIFIVLVFADIGIAQRRKARGRSYTKSHVENVVKRAETRADHFVKNFDDSLDNSTLNGTKREDTLMKWAKKLESETDELKSDFDKSDRWIDNKAQVRKVLNIASDLNKTMKNRRFGKKTESNWARLRYELNTLAKIYRLPTVGSRAFR